LEIPIVVQTSREMEGEFMTKFKANIIWFLVGALVGAGGMYLYCRYAIQHMLFKVG
jgi:hypothetical protein